MNSQMAFRPLAYGLSRSHCTAFWGLGLRFGIRSARTTIGGITVIQLYFLQGLSTKHQIMHRLKAPNTGKTDLFARLSPSLETRNHETCFAYIVWLVSHEAFQISTATGTS